MEEKVIAIYEAYEKALDTPEYGLEKIKSLILSGRKSDFYQEKYKIFREIVKSAGVTADEMDTFQCFLKCVNAYRSSVESMNPLMYLIKKHTPHGLTELTNKRYTLFSAILKNAHITPDQLKDLSSFIDVLVQADKSVFNLHHNTKTKRTNTFITVSALLLSVFSSHIKPISPYASDFLSLSSFVLWALTAQWLLKYFSSSIEELCAFMDVYAEGDTESPWL